MLRPHVAKVVVSNPMATKAIAQAKVKTDKVDAHVLAQLLRCDFLPEVWQPDEATRRLRELTGRRSALVGQRTAMRNRIHSVLAMRLIEAPAGTLRAEEPGVAQDGGDRRPRAACSSTATSGNWSSSKRRSRTLDQELAERGHASDAVKLLMTLPGVDVATAEAMLAAWGDHTRFPDGDHAAAYLGLVPSTKQSADKCYHGPITKRGNCHARWMLIQAAQHLDKHPGPLGHFFRKLMKKKTRNVAVVAAARKLAWIGWTMLHTQRALSLRHPQEYRSQAGQVASEGHRRATQGRRRQRREGRGQTAWRQPYDQVDRRGVCQRGAARAAAGFPPANNARCKRLIARRMLPRSPRRRSCRDPKAEDVRAASTPWPTSRPPMQPLHHDPAALVLLAVVRVPLLWFVRGIMAAIDYRGLRCGSWPGGRFETAGLCRCWPPGRPGARALPAARSAAFGKPLVLCTPGTERLPLLPLRLGGQPARPVGRRHGSNRCIKRPSTCAPSSTATFLGWGG